MTTHHHFDSTNDAEGCSFITEDEIIEARRKDAFNNIKKTAMEWLTIPQTMCARIHQVIIIYFVMDFVKHVITTTAVIYSSCCP